MEDSKFRYVHEEVSDSIDVHHISLKRRHSSSITPTLFLLFLLIIPISLIPKEVWISSWWLGLLFAALLIKILLRKPVHKESVVIMPDFGVQLETHYRRYSCMLLVTLVFDVFWPSIFRKVVRRFVPIGKLLQPVLNECVTPVTCYWSLSMIVRGEEELLLAFKELRPPVKMLVPVWKALCAAIENRLENHSTSS